MHTKTRAPATILDSWCRYEIREGIEWRVSVKTHVGLAPMRETYTRSTAADAGVASWAALYGNGNVTIEERPYREAKVLDGARLYGMEGVPLVSGEVLQHDTGTGIVDVVALKADGDRVMVKHGSERQSVRRAALARP